MLRPRGRHYLLKFSLCGLVCLLLGLGRPTFSNAAPDEDPQTHSLRKACQSAIDTVRNEIDRRRTSHVLLTILGAIAATAGSVAAGLSSRENYRKIGAAVGALSGICTAGIQTLPDTKPAQDRLIAMDRQHIVGEKVFAQLDLLEDAKIRREYVKFVRARYTECTAEAPPTPPDLPAQHALLPVSPSVPVHSKLGEKSQSPPASVEMVAAVQAAQWYWVQLATGELDGLKVKARSLKAEGQSARVYSARCNGEPCYTLLLGPFESKKQAEEASPGSLVTRGKTLESEQPL